MDAKTIINSTIINSLIEADANSWRAMRDRLSKAEDLVKALKPLIPQHYDALNSMLDDLRSDVEKLANSRKKTKLSATEPDTQELAFSGDIMSYDEKQVRGQRTLDALLSSINKVFYPHFNGEITEDKGSDDDIQDLDTEHDIEVDPGEVISFILTRYGVDDQALSYVEGLILPDGQIYVTVEGGNSVTYGGSLHKTVSDCVEDLDKTWGGAETHNSADDEPEGMT